MRLPARRTRGRSLVGAAGVQTHLVHGQAHLLAGDLAEHGVVALAGIGRRGVDAQPAVIVQLDVYRGNIPRVADAKGARQARPTPRLTAPSRLALASPMAPLIVGANGVDQSGDPATGAPPARWPPSGQPPAGCCSGTPGDLGPAWRASMSTADSRAKFCCGGPAPRAAPPQGLLV